MFLQLHGAPPWDTLATPMRFAAIGTFATVLLSSACGPDWDGLLGARLQSEDAGDFPSSPEQTRAGDDRLIRSPADASVEGDAGRDGGVLVESAR